MSVGPISAGVAAAPSLQGAAPAAPAAEVPFSQLVTNLLGEASQQQQNVTHEVQRMVTGETDSVHDVVLSVARADLAFQLVMEVRDQLIQSYQEIMRMQV
jgi:flagellar hook-basal body complex protein FliE